MNSNTYSKKIKKTCTCSTCGKSGHNASNKKIHPDYEFTGVSVPAPKKICKWCEHWMEDWLEDGAEPVRDTKWHYESDMILMIYSEHHLGLSFSYTLVLVERHIHRYLGPECGRPSSNLYSFFRGCLGTQSYMASLLF
jgi:hypothetical protein